MPTPPLLIIENTPRLLYLTMQPDEKPDIVIDEILVIPAFFPSVPVPMQRSEGEFLVLPPNDDSCITVPPRPDDPSEWHHPHTKFYSEKRGCELFFDAPPSMVISLDRDKCIRSNPNPVRQVVPDAIQIPPEILHPLIRVDGKEEEPTATTDHDDDPTIVTTGYASGARSALIQTNQSGGGKESKWYRLKGCSPVELLQGPRGGEIRGCMFPPDTARAAHITNLLGERLRVVRPANSAVGVYEYVNLEEDERVTNCCCVFETRGEKRVRSHILIGLDRLLVHFLPASLDPEVLFGMFPADRIHNSTDAGRALVETAMVKSFYDAERYGTYLDFRSIGADVVPFLVPGEDFVIPEVQSDEHRVAWGEALRVVREYCDRMMMNDDDPKIALSHVLGRLYYRLGMEVGQCLRDVHDADISWGTFFSEDIRFCNAHANNLVVLFEPEQHGHHLRFVSPLDFDFGFTGDSFLGTSDEFQRIKKHAYEVMRCSMAGYEWLPRYEFGEEEGGERRNVGLTLVRMALRDVTVIGFQNGYKGRCLEDLEVSRSELALYRALLAMASIASLECIA